MGQPKYYILICTNQRPPGHPKGCCREKGSMDLYRKFQDCIDEKGLWESAYLVPTGCLGPCEQGANVAIFPENCWYRGVTLQDVEEIVEQHIVNGRRVERLHTPLSVWGFP